MSGYNFVAERPVERYRKSDLSFVAAVIILTGLGLFTLYFCSQNYAGRIFRDTLYFVRRQSISIAVGTAGFILFASLRMDAVRRLLPIMMGGALVLCLLTFVPGISVEKNGARRWIALPFLFTLQPSEVVKFVLILFLANLFDKQAASPADGERSLLPSVVVLLLFVTLVLLQKDLSTSIRWILPVMIAAIPVIVLFITSEQYRIERIIAFLRPEEGAHTINYQSLTAKRAISAGGFWGNGIGSGLVHSNRIPEVQADYIFAGWIEAMGLFGAGIYFLSLGFFAWRGFLAAFTCKNRFASYASFGFIFMISAQSLLNCAVVCGAVPNTGIPLPFFSLGGSSVISTLCMCGFVVNASRITSEEDADAEEGGETGYAERMGAYE